MEGLKGTKVHTVDNYIKPIGAPSNEDPTGPTAGQSRTKAPIVATSPQVLTKNRLYRMIASADINFYLSNQAAPAAATTNDILVPAKVAAVIDTDIYDKLVFVGGGTVQLTELGE